MSAPNWTNVTVSLSSLVPWEHNPRTMTKRQAQRLLKSWRELGQFQTIAIGPDCAVYDGHQRLSALLAAYGAQYQIEARQSDRVLTDDERRYLITQANLPVGAWNFEEIAGWPEAQEWGFDAEMLATWNADGAALSKMLEAEAATGDADAEPQIDRAAELNEKWQVKRGDLWRIGEHYILCGDCTDASDVKRVVMGDNLDLNFSDPPYGVERDEGFTGAVGFAGNGKPIPRRQYDDDWDSERPSKDQFDLMLSLAHESIFWGGNFFADLLPQSTHWIVWNKNNTMPTFGDCELAWTSFGRKSVKKFDVTYNGLIGKEKERYHPTQKPLELYMAVLSEYTKEGDKVIDFYAGSGTTLVACQNLSRKCRAIEISPNYCAVILERMATAFPGIEIDRVDNGTP